MPTNQLKNKHCFNESEKNYSKIIKGLWSLKHCRLSGVMQAVKVSGNLIKIIAMSNTSEEQEKVVVPIIKRRC
jgi:hypothetical protein